MWMCVAVSLVSMGRVCAATVRMCREKSLGLRLIYCNSPSVVLLLWWFMACALQRSVTSSAHRGTRAIPSQSSCSSATTCPTSRKTTWSTTLEVR